jgi:WD40 repeat protein
MSANPYPGLRPFRQDESHLFFGRDGQADAILARLKLQRFVAIVGVSGCGKSSLLNAGVFPGLHGGLLAAGQREWRIARLQPRDQPLQQLARALITAGAVVDQGGETAALATSMLEHSSAGIVNLVRGRLASEGAPPGASRAAGEDRAGSPQETTEGPFALLVVVDQFEEIFRFAASSSPEEASHFVQLLIEAVRAGREGLPVYIALAMRSDFQGDCAVFPGLPELVNEAQYLVPRMNLRQREAAIVCPAATEHREIARPLLDRLLDDMGENPDQLPVLQHALQRTWEAWQRRTGSQGELALEDYLAPEVGGMAGAIEKHAEEAFNSLGSSAAPAGTQQGLTDPDGKTFSPQQRLAGALFRCITERAEGRPPVRRPLLLETIAAIAQVPVPEMVPIIDAFRTQHRTFLTPPEGVPLGPETMIDISHESLIRNWPRLARWAKQESGAAGELRRLRESTNAFLEGSQGTLDELELSRVERWRKGVFADDLLAAPPIVPSEEWARLYLGPDAPEAFRNIRGYIDESAKRLGHRRQKERSMRVAVRMLLVTLLLAGVGFGVQQYRAGLEKASDAKKRLQVISAFAKTADGLAPPISANAKSALAEAEQQTEKITRALLTAGVASPPDGETIADLVSTREVAERAADAMEKLANSMKEAADITNDITLNATSAELGRDATEVRDRRRALQRSPEAFKAIEAAIETRLTAAEQDLAGLNAGQPLDVNLVIAKKEKEIPAATANLSALQAIFGAADALGFESEDFQRVDGRFNALLRTLDAIQELSVGAVASVATLKPEAARGLTHTGRVNRVRFIASPNGTPLLVSGGEDRNIWLWSAEGTQLARMAASSVIVDLAFNAQAKAIAVAGNGSIVRILRWADLSNPVAFKSESFDRHSDSVTDVEFSHGGERVVSGSADRTVRVFDSRTLAPLYFTSPALPAIVTSAKFHRGDNLVVSSCDDGGVRLHTIDPPGVQLLGERMGAPARRAEFSSDGKLVIAASGDKTARVWTISDRREIVNLAHPAPVTQATFRPIKESEGYTFITCATNGEVRFARMTNDTAAGSGPAVTVLKPRHPGSALSASWSADGRWMATVGGGEVLLWDWASDFPVARLRLSGLHRDTSRAEFSPDAKVLATFGGDNTVNLWDLTKIPER